MADIVCQLTGSLHSLRISLLYIQLISSSELIHYIYAFLGALASVVEFCHVHNSLLHPSLAFSYIGSVAAQHSSSGRQSNFSV